MTNKERIDLFGRKMFGLPRSPVPGRGAAKGIARRHLGRSLWLYAVEDAAAGMVKIGVSLDVDSRLASMRSDNPRVLKLTTAITFRPARVVGLCEEYIHEVLRDRCVQGEWFRIPAACADTIINLSVDVVRESSHPGLFSEAASIEAATGDRA